MTPVTVAIRCKRMAYKLAYAGLMLNWLLRRPQTRGVKCLLTDGDRILLVRHSYGPRRWDIPGGGFHHGEPPAETARREMFEELGLADVNWQLMGSIRAIVDHRQDTLHCFTLERPQPGLDVDPVEIAEVRWFARDELPTPRAAHVDAILRLSAIAAEAARTD